VRSERRRLRDLRGWSLPAPARALKSLAARSAPATLRRDDLAVGGARERSQHPGTH
jgi:hypothetical protein